MKPAASHLSKILIASVVVPTLAAASESRSAAALEILIDASVATTETSLGGLPLIIDAVVDVAAASTREDLDIAIRFYGTKQDPGALDCTASLLAVPFGAIDPERLTLGFANLPPSRRIAPLANAIATATADLRARAARSRHLYVIAGTGDGCNADPCAALNEARSNGVSSAGILLLSASREAMRALQCAGPMSTARDPVGVREALANLLQDAGTTTGISFVRHAGNGDFGRFRYSLTPVPAPGRSGIMSSSGAGDVRGVPAGTYTLTIDDQADAPQTVHIVEGQVTRIEDGNGDLVVDVHNFYGADLDAKIAIRPVTTAPVLRKRVPHSTNPVHTPADGAAAARLPRPAPAAPTAASVAANPSLPAAVAIKNGETIALAPGTWEITVNRDGNAMTATVQVTSGATTRHVVRFGALKVERGAGKVQVFDSAGSVVATAVMGRYVHLAPGVYSLRGGNVGGRDIATIASGEVALVEAR